MLTICYQLCLVKIFTMQTLILFRFQKALSFNHNSTLKQAQVQCSVNLIIFNAHTPKTTNCYISCKIKSTFNLCFHPLAHSPLMNPARDTIGKIHYLGIMHNNCLPIWKFKSPMPLICSYSPFIFCLKQKTSYTKSAWQSSQYFVASG